MHTIRVSIAQASDEVQQVVLEVYQLVQARREHKRWRPQLTSDQVQRRAANHCDEVVAIALNLGIKLEVRRPIAQSKLIHCCKELESTCESAFYIQAMTRVCREIEVTQARNKLHAIG